MRLGQNESGMRRYGFWALLAVPALIMAWTFWRDPQTAFDLVHPSGETSVRLMILAMMISPLLAIFGPRKALSWLARRRRAIGVAAFGYAVLHLAFYLVDMGDWLQIWKDAQIFSIWTGYGASLILLAMAVTSHDRAQRALKRNWKRLQRLVYAAALLTGLHWIYVDGDLMAAAVHFIPLSVLEIIRIGIIFNRRSFKRSD